MYKYLMIEDLIYIYNKIGVCSICSGDYLLCYGEIES